jgi:SAM-dependent methyltransferase
MSTATIHDLVPPGEVFVGAGDFLSVGNHFFDLFKKFGGLQPTHDVLDVGAGQGRMAVPFTQYLVSSARYVGIEVVKDAVDWCNQQYKVYPNFKFIHADIYNKLYNAQGQIQDSEYRFPLENESIDFVFLTSVFTHMAPSGVQNYLSEIQRVLRPGGRCVITYFLLNPDSLEFIRTGRTTQLFNHRRFDVCMTTKPDRFEAAVAYDEPYILQAYAQHGLKLVGEPLYGNWVHRSSFVSCQDIIVAEKPVPQR